MESYGIYIGCVYTYKEKYCHNKEEANGKTIQSVITVVWNRTVYTQDVYILTRRNIVTTHPVALDMIQSNIGSERVTMWEYCGHSMQNVICRIYVDRQDSSGFRNCSSFSQRWRVDWLDDKDTRVQLGTSLGSFTRPATECGRILYDREACYGLFKIGRW